jgi:predicted nuclease with TOPRIM domain
MQSYNQTKAYNNIKHNLRHTQNSLSSYNGNANFMITGGELVELNGTNKKNLYTTLRSQNQKDRLEHNGKFYTKHKRNLRDFQATWTDGIITFSEKIHEDLNRKYSKEELAQVANSCALEIAKAYQTDLVYMVLHMDEKTPHFHFALKNFDENGMSLFNKNKNKVFLSALQDIAFEHFKVLGMERGRSKDITGKNYTTIKAYHTKQAIALKNEITNLGEIYTNKREEFTKELKTIYTEVNLQKNNVKDMRDTYKRESEEYKSLTIEFKQLQQEEKLLRAKVRELKEVKNIDSYLVTLKDDLKRILKTNTTKVDPLLGATRLEVNDINKMYNQLFAKIKEPLDTKVVEVTELKEEVTKKDKTIATQAQELSKSHERIESITLQTKRLEVAFNKNYKELNTLKQSISTIVKNRIRRSALLTKLRNSKIITRLRSKFKNNNNNHLSR